MKPAQYLSVDEVIAIHDGLIAVFGGATGILDKGLIDSALARARSGYYDTLALQAAALLESLTLNHAFVDGNKRTALGSMLIFLRLNRIELRVTPEEAERLIVEWIIVKRTPLEEIADWIALKTGARS